MRVEILAIGRLKDEAEAAIVARYQQRFDKTGWPPGLGPLTVTDFAESRTPLSPGVESLCLLAASAPAAIAASNHYCAAGF